MTGTEFHRLYEEYASDVFRFAWYVSGDRALAEDVTSETFVRAWTAPGTIRTETVKAWLFAIARNLCVSHWRRANHEVPLDPAMRETAASPRDAAESRIELDRARHAMRSLPEGERTALAMRALGALSYDEIGRALEISPAAAKVRVHRARLKLAAACQREATK
jgi:RNA polymerase sigma-70 factor (ECF subfamily)